jgi:hypothetical protein
MIKLLRIKFNILWEINIMSSIKEGVQVLVFFIGLLLIIGTIGVIEMNEQPDYIMVAGQTFLGFLLMWIGAKGVNKIE